MTDADKVHGSAVTVQVGSKHHMSVNPNFLKFLTQGSGRRLVLWYIHNISETINRRRQEQAVRELSILYSRRDELLPAARDCLNITRRKLQLKWRIVWLNTYRSLFRSSIRRAAKSAAGGTLSILHYFTCLERQDVVL